LGLNNNSTVLEIGCGIGALTYLLAKSIKQGKIEATDLSPKSIEYVKKNLTQDNLLLYAGDILQLKPTNSSFDFILLFDVIEHIPQENHGALFSKVSGWMHKESHLLINIPNPLSIIYDQKHNPAALQEVDQPIFIDALAAQLNKAGLDIQQFETYGVWAKNDYQFFVIKQRADFVEEIISSKRNFFQKIAARSKRELRKMIYRYPVK
jgi:cyclopropane fatty-acyl-phospholipid synthase-like methyltransferase